MTEIKYKDTVFLVNNDRLAVRKAATPLIVKYRKLRAEYLSDVDRSFIDNYDKEINRLKLAIEQVKVKDLNEKIANDNEKTYGEYLKELEERLSNAIEEKQNDLRVSIVETEINEIETMIYLQLICYTDLMYKLYAELKGDISIINPNDDDYEKFALEILTSFFGISFQRILESQNSNKIIA